MVTELRVHLLGAFRLYRDGSAVAPQAWHTRQARQLFKVLLLERGKMVPAERLQDLVWHEAFVPAATTLRTAINALRHVLEPERPAHMPSAFVPRGRGGYTLVIPPTCSLWLDTLAFEHELSAALAGSNTSPGRERLRAALAAYAGDYLAEDEGESWTRMERERLRDLYVVGVARLADWSLASGCPADALDHLHRAIARDPYRETLYGHVMKCQVALGKPTEALRTFDRLRRLLADEMGIDPPQALAQLHTAILRGEAVVPLSGTVGLVQRDPFVGRQRERAELRAHLHRLHDAARPAVVAIRAAPGLGTSRLLAEFAAEATATGARVARVTCLPGDAGHPYALIATLLDAWQSAAPEDGLASDMQPDALAVVAPPKGMTGVPALPPATLARMLAQQTHAQPCVLVVEQMQWADAASLSVLERLMGQPGVALLVVAAWQPGDGAPPWERTRHRWAAIVPYREMTLAPLTPPEVTDYLRHAGVTAPECVAHVTDLCRGHVLYLAEVVRWWQSASDGAVEDLAALTAEECAAVPRVRAHILARITALTPDERRWLECAALVNQSFYPAWFTDAPRAADDAALDGLVHHALLAPHVAEEEGLLTLAHPFIGPVVRDVCAPLRRTQLHREIADGLAQWVLPHNPLLAAQVAAHYRQAGPHARPLVLRHTVEAGDAAWQHFHYRDALNHYDAAIATHATLTAAQRRANPTQIALWLSRAQVGRGLASEALLDWDELQRSHMLLWSSSQFTGQHISQGAYRLAMMRSVMGHLDEGAHLVQTFLERLGAHEMLALPTDQDDHMVVALVRDLLQRALRLLVLTPSIADVLGEGQAQGTSAPLTPPRFAPAPAPLPLEPQEVLERTGAENGTFLLTMLGWALLLQGEMSVALRYLTLAVRAAEATKQVTSSILAATMLYRAEFARGRADRGHAWHRWIAGRIRHAPEMTWAMLWPQIDFAFRLIMTQEGDAAEDLLDHLERFLTQQDDFISHRNAVGIARGMLAWHRGRFDEARCILATALAVPEQNYIEAYVQGELALAHIAYATGDAEGAVQRFIAIMRFCADRALLDPYCQAGLDVAQLVHDGPVAAAMRPLVPHIAQLAERAHLIERAQTARSLVARFALTQATHDQRLS